jgi:murein DD-endopeptidase MepM/ murein hydrolase activator NlpD
MTTPTLRDEFGEFLSQLQKYLGRHLMRVFFRFESGKDLVVGGLYQKRGKYAQPFLHASMMTLIFFGIAFGPNLVRDTLAESERIEAPTPVGEVLGESLSEAGLVTLESDKPPATVQDYVVRDGDTLSGIASKFGVSSESIKWLNENMNFLKMKPGEVVKIPPVTGVVYKVRPGDTIHSIAKKFDANAQAIVDFPFNTFSDDETFALVAGQTLMVPDGVMPNTPVAPTTTARFAAVLTPDAGSVSATGSFVWPAQGRITQGFRWYHPAIDVASNGGGPIVAADAGVVVTSGWSSAGYGNHVVIDHQNGWKSLYAHLSSLNVAVGQRVNRGGLLGQMGSTGRSTGTHLHFELIGASGKVDPLAYLK